MNETDILQWICIILLGTGNIIYASIGLKGLKNSKEYLIKLNKLIDKNISKHI